MRNAILGNDLKATYFPENVYMCINKEKCMYFYQIAGMLQFSTNTCSLLAAGFFSKGH